MAFRDNRQDNEIFKCDPSPGQCLMKFPIIF